MTVPTQIAGGDSVPAIVRQIIGTERYLEMDRRRAYLEGSQHDTKRHDFDGRPITPGPIYYGGWISQEKMPGGPVPLRARRPCMPARLGRTIISAFTDLVFGEGRDPEPTIVGDAIATDFARAVVEASGLPSRLIQARDLGGAMGSVGLSWAIVAGRPVVRVHSAQGLRVVEWEDRDALAPRVVEEVRLFSRDEYDPGETRVVRRYFWRRRTWTPNEDLVYREVPAKGGEAQQWDVDEQLSSRHGDGVTHFAWIQNLPSEDEDGYSDLGGLWEQCDEVDAIYSVISRGAKANLDPTLKLKVDPAAVQIMGVRKGSDQAIIVGAGGDASYLELSGTSITAGLALYESQRRTVLESARCVVPDPNTVAAQGISSLSIKALYAPMLGRGSVLREQYGAGVKRVLDGILTVCRERLRRPIEVVDPETGQKRTGKFVLRLPPRIVDLSPAHAEENETLEEEAAEQVSVPRDPGKEGGEVSFTWPKWFSATPADLLQESQTVTAATGGKSYMSQQTATESFARSMGLDAREEWERVRSQGAADQAAQAEMFQPGGVSVGQAAATDEAGGMMSATGGAPVGGAGAELTASDIASIVTVNEGRSGAGLGPLLGLDGKPDKDGSLTVAEFKAKRQALAQAEAEVRKAEATGGTAKPRPFGG